MREPPVDLSDDTLRARLRADYGLAVADLTFLPLGHDSVAWVYRVVTAGGRALFLMARRGGGVFGPIKRMGAVRTGDRAIFRQFGYSAVCVAAEAPFEPARENGIDAELVLALRRFS